MKLEESLYNARRMILELIDDSHNFIKYGSLPMATGQNIKRVEEALPKIVCSLGTLRELAEQIRAMQEEINIHALEVENAKARELTPAQFEEAMQIGTPIGSA